MPSRVVLCSRDSQPRIYLEEHRTYYGTGSDLPNTRDLETGERRASLLQDVAQTARLADGLPNLDFVMSMALPSGPGGEYLSTDHTADHFLSVWYPRLFNRQDYHAWAEVGQPTAIESARDLARQVIASHKPTPMQDSTLAKVTAIVAEADARAALTSAKS